MSRVGELAENVPGLIATQHPGTGKANQYSLSLTGARFAGVSTGEDRIPNAIGTVLAGGATLAVTDRLSATLRLRHSGSDSLVADGSARSAATTLVNAGAFHAAGRATIGLELLNLLGSRASDITRCYASRLAGEAAGGVVDRHLHPVEPRQVRVSIQRAS